MVSIVHVVPLVHVLLLVTFAIITSWLVFSKRRLPTFRQLDALAAIPEVIGRCVETGRPLLFTQGTADLRTSASLTVSGFTILGEVMRESIRKGSEVIVVSNHGEQLPILRSIMEEAYQLEGKPEEMKTENLVFIGGGTYAQIASICHVMETRNVAGLIFPGMLAGADSPIYGDYAARIGALSIIGSTNIYTWPFCVSCYDYSLLGEDVLAAGCVLSQEPMMTSSIWSGDLYRFVLVAVIIIGFVASWLGINVIGWFTST